MSTNQIRLSILLLGIVLFLPALGLVHLFDWDEINFAESAREMIMTGDYFRVQINYEPFWEKPPLFMWLQVICMKIFGITEFAARLPNALTGIVTLQVLFNVGNRLYERRFGLLWVAAYIGTFLPHFYFKSGIIDPIFNLFIFLGIVYLHDAFSLKKNSKAIIAGIFIGLAILTKGPVALLISGLCTVIYILVNREFKWSSLGYLALFGVSVAVIASAWFGLETYKNGSWFIQEFIKYNIRLFNTEDSGHGQPVYYHPIVLLIGCFPVSIFMLKYIFRPYKDKENGAEWMLWMKLLFWCVLVIFSIVKTKIVHYSSLCYFPMTFIGAYAVYNFSKTNKKIPSGMVITLTILGTLLAAIITAIPLIPKYKEKLFPYIGDKFAKANIENPVQWGGYEFIAGGVLLIVVFIAIFFYKDAFKYALTLFIGVVLCLQLTLYLVVPKLEQHIQGPLIDFLQARQQEDCYVKVLGLKSYAQYFYTNRKPDYNKNPNAENEQWLMSGEIDKPAYFITKSDRDYYRLNPELELILEKGGYVGYKRKLK
jgi:4-amino-4-deoxy-L-arabinose transferase-like glycosyltransferase